MPFDGVGGQEMAEQLSDDAETIGLVSVDGLVVLNKLAFEKFAPEAVKLAKSLSNLAIELLESSLLTSTFDDHARKLFLKTSR